MAAADGAVSLFEKDADEARLYRCARRLPLDACGDALGLGHGGGRPRVRSLALSAAEDALLLALASCQLLSLNLGAAELAKARAARLRGPRIACCVSLAGQRVGDNGHAPRAAGRRAPALPGPGSWAGHGLQSARAARQSRALSGRAARPQADEYVYAAVPHAFHAAEATGVATCMRKPLVATCSLDRTLRLWNYQDWCAPTLGAPAWPAVPPARRRA